MKINLFFLGIVVSHGTFAKINRLKNFNSFHGRRLARDPKFHKNPTKNIRREAASRAVPADEGNDSFKHWQWKVFSNTQIHLLEEPEFHRIQCRYFFEKWFERNKKILRWQAKMRRLHDIQIDDLTAVKIDTSH